MCREVVRASSMSYCTSRTAKKNITSEFLVDCVCVFVGGQSGVEMLGSSNTVGNASNTA